MSKPEDASLEPSPEQRARDASVAMKPAFRHAKVGGTLAFATAQFETMHWKETLDVYANACDRTRSADLGGASNMLTSQALTLDAVFTEMLSRATQNIGKYPDAVERYMRLALKAQSQSRATLETLVKMHQPREQTVRHVHVGPNGQAVFIENMYGRMGNAQLDGQAHAPDAEGAALLRHDAGGLGLPIPSSPREATVPHARRRAGKRRSAGE